MVVSASIGSLPFDAIQKALSYLSLEEIQTGCRGTSVLLRDACDLDPRWIPVIAPPSLAHEILDLKKHGKELRRLHHEFWKWHENWFFDPDVEEQELRSKQSALDGFFSLAPWEKGRAGRLSYPTPWLHRMVYGHSCPTEVSASTDSSSDGKVWGQKNGEKSLFFQQRVRSGEDMFRLFTSNPIMPNPKREKIRRVLLQPVNLRKRNGRKHPRLPDHNAEGLEGLNDACKRILECYFGENVVVKPTMEHRARLTLQRAGGYCRNDVQGRVDANGRPVVQVTSEALVGVCGAASDDAPSDDTAIILTIAPHMFYEGKYTSLSWTFASSLYDDHEDVYPNTRPWCISTFQFYQHIQDSKSLQCRFARAVLYGVLQQLEMGTVCENKHCALNNSDDIGEEEESSHLILCPGCIRKLQLGGIVHDVPMLLRQLSLVLQEEPFASGCQKDRQTLAGYGYGSARSAKERSPKRMKV